MNSFFWGRNGRPSRSLYFYQEVIIDNRETKIKDYFSNQINNIDLFKFENLDIGDIVIKYNGVVKYIFERKTLRDLAESIKDNRYHEQKQRMKFSSSSDVKISYIFEYFINYDSLEPDIQISNLRGDVVLSAILNTWSIVFGSLK